MHKLFRPCLARRRDSERLARDSRGAALVEFALIAPVLAMMLLGVFEIGYNYYIQSQLQGTVQKAARASTIEGAAAKETTIDERVKTAVQTVNSKANVSFERKSYATFSDVAQSEDFTDSNDDGVCNDGEQFEDANGNDMWDADRGKEGLGGARDVVLYTATITYPRAFGVSKMLGAEDTVTFEATTVLRNQPYDEQISLAKVGYCT